MVSTDLIKEIFPIEDQEGIRELSEIAYVRCYEKGETIYEIGDMQETIYIMLSGIVYSYFIDETQTVITDCFIVERGYPISTENFELPSMFTTQALMKTEVLELPIAATLELMRVHQDLLWEYVRFMQMGLTFHWYIANKRIHYPAKKKYEWFRETWPELDQVASNQQIASFLGIRPESLSRLRHLVKTSGEKTEDDEDADIMVTQDLEWNYSRMSKALKKGQYKKAKTAGKGRKKE